MKVEINLDDAQFAQLSELLEGHLSNLSDDVIKDVLVNCIHEYFAQDNYKNIEKLFIDIKDVYGYRERCANQFLKRLTMDCDFSKLQDVLDKAIENLKENNEKILRDVFIDAIAEKICGTYSMQSRIRDALMEIRNN